MKKTGGYRPGSGKKKIGESRKLTLTLPKEFWAEIDKMVKEKNSKLAVVIREELLFALSQRKGESKDGD
ncbi:CopG family transcriptional regulator [Paenibacillus alvei]|uniref:CopG family transcriptional regulator n=1 Tax=Paenibacillus alvei TaxID=44250 RepID=UPI002281C3D0|nr:CopG family transcriptional regulator [Paenibacillus alvei]